MKIAFFLIPEKGQLNPYIGAAQVAAAGLAFHALPGSSDRPTHGAALVELIQDAERLAAWAGQLLLDGLNAQVEQLRNLYRKAAIDVVAVDPIYYAASLAGEPAGLPWAGVFRFRRRASATWFSHWGTI